MPRPSFLSLTIAGVLLALGSPAAAQAPTGPIVAAVADTHRAPANVARDRYRHPVETLAFFGLTPTQTVVEYQPAGGWYTEILAPLLSARGHYVGLVSATEKARTGFAGVLATGGARYAGAQIATLDAQTGAGTVPAGSADLVLTFRNVHNALMGEGMAAPKLFAAFYRMLKPGGVLGIEEHRLPEEMDSARERTSGYVKRSTIVRLATAAGFRLAGESAVNANPADTHDWPKGVWTLPPTLELGETNRAKYLAIGESDRLTLKFVKPAT